MSPRPMRRRTPLSYGPHRAQVADIWRPTHAAGKVPVVVLIHGGFWRQLYTKRLMRGLAQAIVAHGWIAYNLEYRRVGAGGAGGWPLTFEDVAAGINALAGIDAVDMTRIVTCGHSAGGHLALWAASPRQTGADLSRQAVRVRHAISLAGVVDLIEAARLGLGGGAVQALMGGGPDVVPERYAFGSPASLLPLGVPQTLIHGLNDSTVPPSLSRDYAALAVDRGDDARFVPLPGVGHMDIIDPHGAVWDAIAACLAP